MKTKGSVWKKFPLGRFLRFGVVGFSGLFVDLVVFYLLRELMSLPLYLSTALSIETAIVNNFLWNDAWTFADLAQKAKGWRARLGRFYKFNLVCLLGAFLQVGIMAVLLLIPMVNQLPSVIAQVVTADWVDNANEYFAKVVAIAIVTLWNFWMNLKLSWRTKK
ncbi:MAG: GtrA family protein [Phormidesmis sp. RL_2_1]|nr:GtrA family protein [Phormidesmis sp. RL_2_1]